MAEIVKVVLDGTLFSECKMLGANRDGMMRLTEDITDRLVLNQNLDIFFASTLFIEKYDIALHDFIKEHYPGYLNKIFSKKPPSFTNLLTWRNLFRKSLSKLPISPKYAEIDEQDIFHSFYYPFSTTVSKNKIKRSVTFLDIIPLKMNGYSNNLVQRTKAIVDCIAANHGIAISEFSRQDLLNYDKKIDPAKVFVAPLAASEKLFYRNRNEMDWKRVKEKYDLPDNYFLCVSGRDLRKNIPHLIKSFNNFVLQEKPADVHLVLTGNASQNHGLLDELGISKPVKDKIFIPRTFIDSEDLASLYSNALCFFFMSLYEGFGLPALEAMQCGVPTVASNTTSLPEVVGDAGILLPPSDEDALSEAMSRLYKDETLREKYAMAGLQRAKSFSWQKCADQYAAIFKNISDRK